MQSIKLQKTKRTLPMLALTVLTLGLSLTGSQAVLAQEAPIRIAVVNLDYVVANSPGGQALQAKLQEFQQAAQTGGEALAQQAHDIQQRAADGANALSESALSELQKEYEDKQIEIRRYQDDKQREGQKMQTEGLAEIEQQLEPVFQQVRDEDGYDLILNNVPGVVVMSGPRVDITQKILDLLAAAS